LIASSKAVGVQVKDEITGHQFEINASVIVNATGPWAYKLLDSVLSNEKYKQQPLSKNFNIVIDGIGKDFAFGVKSKRESDAVLGESKRVYFFTPWLDKTVIGTAHFNHDPEAPIDTDVSVELPGFIEEVNEAYPSLDITQEDVEYVYSGFTPAESTTANHDTSRAHHTSLIDHADVDGIQNLLTVIGVKYTTARSTAQQVVNRVLKNLKANIKTIPNYTIEELRDDLSVVDDLSLDADVSEHDVDSIYRKNRTAHLHRAVDTEMVLKLEDYVLRRNNLTMRYLLDVQDLNIITTNLGEKLNLSKDEIQSQLNSINTKIHI